MCDIWNTAWSMLYTTCDMWYMTHNIRDATWVRTSWGSRMSRPSGSCSGILGNMKVGGSSPDVPVFEPWSSQTNDFKFDTCRSLAWHSTLLGWGKDWLVQCQNNVTEWDSRSWCWWPGVPVTQYYKVAMSTHCHKLVPVPPALGLSHIYEAPLHTSLDH